MGRIVRAASEMSAAALECGADEEVRATRCACSFPHPPHDWCDGNPNGKTFADLFKQQTQEAGDGGQA